MQPQGLHERYVSQAPDPEHVRRLAKWDMRTSQGVVQDLGSPVVGYESGKDYSRGTNFTCMATTGVDMLVIIY